MDKEKENYLKRCMDLYIEVRSGLVVIMLLMKAVEEKQTMGDIRVKYMYPLSPLQGKTGIIKERDENSYKYVTVYFDDGIRIKMRSIRI